MAVKSVYVPEPKFHEGRLRLQGEEHQHLRVGRANQGEPIEIFDGRGLLWKSELESSARHETVLRVLGEERVARSEPELILGLSLIKSAAFELALEKAVEIGVTQIIPLRASRSNVRPDTRPERWTRILVEAAKQSKRYHLPELLAPVEFSEVLEVSAATKIVLAERGGGPLQDALKGAPILFLVGPEGGWTDAELEAARAKHFKLVGLGEGILRAETAAIVGAALLRYEFHRNL